MIYETVYKHLAAPFEPEQVSWRPGSTNKDKTKAKALAYIDARDVMRRLDEACTPAGWQCDYLPMPNGTTCCRIEIMLDGQWVGKANGAGATDIEGEKGGYSDAFKRAAVMWGIGRYLYDIDAPWVRINQWKQIEDDEMPRLRALLGAPPPQSARQARKDGNYERITGLLRHCTTLDDLQMIWATESSFIARMPDKWREHLTAEKDRLKEALKARVS